MASDPRIRASDADRDRVADALREHHATGRLSMDEFQERLDRALAAKTLGELDELMTDLPAIDLYQLPIPASQRAAPPSAPAPSQLPGRLSPVWRAAWASWASVTMICVVIWLIAGQGYFWPIWVAGPWGALMGARWLFGAAPHGPPHGRTQGRDELRSRRHDVREQVRAQRSELRRNLRSARDDLRHGLPWDPPAGQDGDDRRE
jgi:hypothetical protein